MKEDFDMRSYFAGYPDKDSMREKAKRLMLEEMMNTQMNKPASHSTPSHEKMRPYKKGGHVKGHHSHYEHEHEHHAKHHAHHSHHEHHEGKEKKRAHLHKLQREGLHEAERNLEKERHLSHGGHAKHHSKHYKHGGHHDVMGGSLTNLHLPKYKKLNVESLSEAEHMKKGGRSHHKHHAHHHHDHHEHHHKPMRKAAGGTVYEHEMLGEHPSRKRPHINYEKDMVGMHAVHKAHAKSGSRHGNPGAVDQSFGQYLKKGGKCKMAAGGAAKVRHGVMTPSGRPIMHKKKMGY